MSRPGGADELGRVVIDESFKTGFASPANPGGGSNRDMGSLALMLIANWFINGKHAQIAWLKGSSLKHMDLLGETVLIDGGVSWSWLHVLVFH